VVYIDKYQAAFQNRKLTIDAALAADLKTQLAEGESRPD
jgi:hypothetical protein